MTIPGQVAPEWQRARSRATPSLLDDGRHIQVVGACRDMGRVCTDKAVHRAVSHQVHRSPLSRAYDSSPPLAARSPTSAAAAGSPFSSAHRGSGSQRWASPLAIPPSSVMLAPSLALVHWLGLPAIELGPRPFWSLPMHHTQALLSGQGHRAAPGTERRHDAVGLSATCSLGAIVSLRPSGRL